MSASTGANALGRRATNSLKLRIEVDEAEIGTASRAVPPAPSANDNRFSPNASMASAVRNLFRKAHSVR